MRRVAIPIYNNKLSESFGQCSHYEIFEIDDKKIKNNRFEHPPYQDAEEIAKWVESLGVTDIITYKMDKPTILFFSNTKVNLFVGIPVSTPKAVIENYLKGNLKSDLNIINETLIEGFNIEA